MFFVLLLPVFYFQKVGIRNAPNVFSKYLQEDRVGEKKNFGVHSFFLLLLFLGKEV